MKKLLTLLAACGAMIYFSSCGDDDSPTAGSLSITGIPASESIDFLGTLGPVTATLSAEDGLASLTITKDGDAFADSTFTGQNSATVEFSYTAVEADGGNNIVFVFTIEDANGDRQSAQHVLTVNEFEPQFTVVDATEDRGPDEDNTTSYPQNLVTGLTGVSLLPQALH